MHFSNRNIEISPVILNGAELERVTYTKFLGVIIDDKFTWIKHIDVVKNKVSKAIGAMYRVKDSVDEKTLLMIYRTECVSEANGLRSKPFAKQTHEVLS